MNYELIWKCITNSSFIQYSQLLHHSNCSCKSTRGKLILLGVTQFNQFSRGEKRKIGRKLEGRKLANDVTFNFFITGKNRRYHPDVLFQNQQLVWYLDKGNRLELKKMIKSLQKSALWGREETNKLIVVVPKAASLTNEIGPSRILGNWLVYYIA